ncbi:MAG TPA: radical SAM protein [Azospirillaceae bacterium]|nr:radical SAM protein [Azospirillaceae bacterium]
MALDVSLVSPPLDARKFRDPLRTAKGEPRASVGLKALKTLWFNTGTLCNVACPHCYIESSPTNDRLVYLTAGEVAAFLDEIETLGLPTEEIGFTGGEPFMNRELPVMLEDSLARGFRVLVLTNAMRPMMLRRQELLGLGELFGDRLVLRVSLDHYTRQGHDAERGPGAWERTLEGLLWLERNGFTVHIAGRTLSGEPHLELRRGYARLLANLGVAIDADDPGRLVLFPEMDARHDVPEITERCWDILHRSPDSVMCATSRMVVKRKGADRPAVVACTLIPQDAGFELGATLANAASHVHLNHPHCAKFCVLGGAACSRP